MFRAILMLLLLAPFLAQAEMYKWVDKDGKVHYSQTPPPKGTAKSPAEKVSPTQQRPIGTDNTSPGLQQYVDDVSKANQKRDEAKASEQKKDNQRQQRCEQARSRFAMLDRYGRVGTVQPDGSIQAWDEERRAREAAEAQAAVSESCS